MKKLINVICSVLLLFISSPVNKTIAADEINLNKFPNEEVSIQKDTIGKKTFFVVKNSNNKVIFLSREDNKTMYTAAALNVRNIPTIESTPARTLDINTEVQRVGKSNCGWDIIFLDEEYFFVWNEYLSLDPVQVPIVEEYYEQYYEPEPIYYDSAYYSPSEFRVLGVIYQGGWRWTWYSERVLPGGGLHIPGRYTDNLGYVRDENGYLCLASEALPWGTVVDTPFGSPGRVYDSGCDYDVLDVYVGW